MHSQTINSNTYLLNYVGRFPGNFTDHSRGFLDGHHFLDDVRGFTNGLTDHLVTKWSTAPLNNNIHES